MTIEEIMRQHPEAVEKIAKMKALDEFAPAMEYEYDIDDGRLSGYAYYHSLDKENPRKKLSEKMEQAFLEKFGETIEGSSEDEKKTVIDHWIDVDDYYEDRVKVDMRGADDGYIEELNGEITDYVAWDLMDDYEDYFLEVWENHLDVLRDENGKQIDETEAMELVQKYGIDVYNKIEPTAEQKQWAKNLYETQMPSKQVKTAEVHAGERNIPNPEKSNTTSLAALESRKDVIKLFVSDGKKLYFSPLENGKYEFCSNDEKLQKWCDSVKNKQVKKNALKFVVNGARDYLKGKTELRTAGGASVSANWNDNPVGTLQETLQKQGKMPTYSKSGDEYYHFVTLSVPGYGDVTEGGFENYKELNRRCAMKFAQTYLGIDFEAERKKAEQMPKQPQVVPQLSEKLPQTFAVEPDKCGNWDRDAVSALQVFCQKNKMLLPQYYNRGTSQGYVTRTTMTMHLGDYETTQSAATKQEAKQLCARKYKEEMLERKGKQQNRTQGVKAEQSGKPDPTIYPGWKVEPFITLEMYCHDNGIPMKVDIDILREEDPVLTVGEEKFSLFNPEYEDMTNLQIKDDLAKFYYQKKVLPLLRQAQKQAHNETSADDLKNIDVPNMSQYQQPDNNAWTGILNQLCAKAHLPNPKFVEAAVVRDGVEMKCQRFPSEFEMKGSRFGETKVMYLKMAGMQGKIRGEGKDFRNAKHAAAKNCLTLIWYDRKIEQAHEDGDDGKAKTYQTLKQKFAQTCYSETVKEPKTVQKEQNGILAEALRNALQNEKK